MDQQHHAINLNVRGIQPSATLRINELSNQLRSEGRDIIKLGLGQSPFPVPERVVEALRTHAHEKDYLPVKGLKTLREAIAGYINRSERMRCSWEDVLIGPGSKELLFILQLAYYGDLLIPRPSWVSYAPQARIIGRSVYWLPTHAENNWQLTAEELDIICRDDPTRPRILILNYPSNPTGCTYTDDQLLALAHVARTEGGFYLLPDFAAYRDALEAVDIKTSAALCTRLLEATGIAILPGSDFGFSPDQLFARLAFVDFDGAAVLALAAGQYAEQALDDAFIASACPRLVNAMDKLEAWLARPH